MLPAFWFIRSGKMIYVDEAITQLHRKEKETGRKTENSLPIHSCGMKGEGVFCKQGILLFTTLLLGGSEL